MSLRALNVDYTGEVSAFAGLAMRDAVANDLTGWNRYDVHRIAGRRRVSAYCFDSQSRVRWTASRTGVGSHPSESRA